MDETIPKSELLFQKSKPIDQLATIDGIELILKEQKKAVNEVIKASESINYAISKIVNKLKSHSNGRLIYVGAGTSGRIGIQDSVELYPTFNWPKHRVGHIIAGGKHAILNAVENAEDDEIAAINQTDLMLINLNDVVIGLAASGNTPFTCKVLEESQNKKALTIAISNNPDGNILKFGDVKIVLNTQEEVIAGSTRLKAGTSQKICLNTISSIVMVKMGFIKNGQMINLVPTNKKLLKRKLRIDSQ